MKNERILNALERADDRYVEEAAPAKALKDAAFEAEAVQAEPVIVAAPKRKVYAGRIAAAACACAAVGGLVVWGAVGGAGRLTENPATADTGEEYAQTGSPESNGYHNFTLTQEELYNCAWSCFIPEYFPAGYHFLGDAQCTETIGLIRTDIDLNISFWLSNGIDDPDTVGYNPINFLVTVADHSFNYSSPVYDLQALTVSDIAEMGKGGLIDCGNNVMIQIGCPYPEVVSDEEMYKMIMSMPYARQWQDTNGSYFTKYLTGEETYGTPFADYLPTVLPAGYNITGLSPYTYSLLSANDNNSSIILYIGNGVEDTSLPSYCPIRYTVLSHGDGTDTSGKPVYLDIRELTLDDVETAMESGGFFTTFTETDLIEVSFPYPDRVSAEEIYNMVMSAPCAADPNAEPEAEYTMVYLSREELYTNMWTMYVPRELPEGYVLDGSYWGWAVFEPSGFPNGGTIYIKLTDDNNPISYTIYADSLKYDTLGAGAEFFTRYSGIDEVHLLKEYGWIDFENATVKVKVDIADPDLISDEELYAFVMSTPAFDNFAATGLDTTALDSRIYTDLPVVKFDPYYDVERYTLSGEVFESTDSIIGFDGTYAYFHDQPHKNENGQQIYKIGWYNVKTGETGFLPEDGYTGKLGYIYSDGEYVYCSKQKLTDEEEYEYKVVRYNVESGREEIILELSNALLMGNVTVNSNYMFMYVYYLDSSEYKLVSYYMNSGVFGTKAKSISDLPGAAFNYIDVDDVSYAVTMPYKNGVIYVMPAGEIPDFIAPSCYMFYWDGKNPAVPLFEARLDSIYDGEKGEQLCFSDGETVYFVRETYANGVDDFSGMQDTLFAFDLTSAFTGFDFPREHILADNKNPTNSPFHEWHGTAAACAGGMVAIDPYSGLIYDAENGWFTHVNKNVYYRVIRNDSSFEGMTMIEYADVEYDANADFVDYPEEGNDLTLCIITRK